MDWYPIKVVARRTGLSSHVIRAWEKRYDAVVPRRTETNRRVYSEEDLERLVLLRRATLAGRSIGQVAPLPTEELRAVVEADEAAQRAAPGTTATQRTRPSTSTILEECVRAIENLDAEALRSALGRASTSLSKPSLTQEVVGPLLERVGQEWRDGSLKVAHEHLASATIRTFLGNLNGGFATTPESPNLVVATPAGQLHELGALLAATTAASEGWRVTYLGASLPADEIAGAVSQSGARAVALSITYPPDDPNLKDELRRLRQLEPEVPLFIGGRGSQGYADALEEIGAVGLSTLEELRSELVSLRSKN